MGLFEYLGRVGSTAGGAAGLSLAGSGIGLLGTIGTSLLANRRDLKMWRMNNAYNSPEAQMARLKKAGLNPNLVYGSGQLVGNTQSQRPQTYIPNIAQTIPDVVGTIAQSQNTAYKIAAEKLAYKNAELMEENKKLIGAKIGTEWSKQEDLFRSANKKLTETSIMSKLFPYQESIKKLQAENIFPKLAEKYGYQNADMLFKINNLNPALLANLKARTSKERELIQQLMNANLVGSSLAPYNADSRTNILIKLFLKLIEPDSGSW